MKNICLLIVLACCTNLINAQTTSIKKQPTIGLHFFYNDFAKSGKVRNMEGGFGLDYIQGLTRNIDAVGTINASWVNYLLPSGTLYGSSNAMLDMNAGAHLKLLRDSYAFNPFLVLKAGYTSYKNISGFSFLPGAGMQVNLFDEAFILATAEYRRALSNKLSNQLYYSIGIATGLFKKKPKVQKPEEAIVVLPPVKAEVIPEIIIAAKDIVVTIADEATGQPLQFVTIVLTSENGSQVTAVSDADGKVTFKNAEAKNYNISGILNKVNATSRDLAKVDFNISGESIPVNIAHNDPRFTLVGNTVDTKADRAIGNTEITINNTTKSSTAITTSSEGNGEFRTQLEPQSDFVIVGKKSSYISNIENVSTKGLNRSATLYVKLELDIQEAKAGANIILNNIYFETGKANLNLASGDLNKLIVFLKDNPGARLEIQGHTDITGSALSNLKLSQLRANSVVNHLVKNGIRSERLLAKGYGASTPIADNTTTIGKAENRRVVMKVLE